MMRVRGSFIWQDLWEELLAALPLAVWQMLALTGAPGKGASLSACQDMPVGRGGTGIGKHSKLLSGEASGAEG